MEDKLEQEFATYEQAVALKELGFDYDCFLYWYKSEPENLLLRRHDHIVNNAKCVPAPLKVQAFKWFQEKNLWFHTISYHRKAYPNTNQYKWKVDIGLDLFDCKGWSDTYEEAENACIDKLIELAKTK